MDEINFGEWLSRQRKILGMTQQQLAEQINCAAITVRKLEAQERRPSVQILEQLCRVFNILPGECQAFFRFARGYGQQDAVSIMEDHPWRNSASPAEVNLPPIPSLFWETFTSSYQQVLITWIQSVDPTT
jgi:transcriptional regulator with XRE-family HTH domain